MLRSALILGLGLLAVACVQPSAEPVPAAPPPVAVQGLPMAQQPALALAQARQVPVPMRPYQPPIARPFSVCDPGDPHAAEAFAGQSAETCLFTQCPGGTVPASINPNHGRLRAPG